MVLFDEFGLWFVVIVDMYVYVDYVMGVWLLK